jgi:hypothetical protein
MFPAQPKLCQPVFEPCLLKDTELLEADIISYATLMEKKNLHF